MKIIILIILFGTGIYAIVRCFLDRNNIIAYKIIIAVIYLSAGIGGIIGFVNKVPFNKFLELSATGGIVGVGVALFLFSLAMIHE